MDVESLFLRGKEAADRGNYDYAIEVFLDILRVAPNHRNSRVALRGCEMEKFRESGGGFMARVRGFFKAVGPFLSVFLLKGKPEKIIENCEKYLAHDPANIPVMMRLANALRGLGYLEAAADTLEYARQRNPKHVPLLRLLAEAHYELEQYDKSVRAYQEILAVKPEDREASEKVRHISAESHIRRSGMEQAQSYRESLRDEETSQTLEREAHVVRSDEERTSEVEKLQESAAQNPNDANAFMRLGDAFSRNEQYAEAETAYRKAFELSKRYQAREKLGNMRIRRLERAEEKARREAEAAGNVPGCMTAVQEARRNRLAFCVKEFEFRRKQHPTDMRLAVDLGTYYFDLGGDEGIRDAIQQFQNAMASPSLRIRAQLMLGRCFALNPKTLDMAKEQFGNALDALEDKTGDTGKALMYELGDASEKSGDKTEALTWYKKIFSVDAAFRDVREKIQNLA